LAYIQTFWLSFKSWLFLVGRARAVVFSRTLNTLSSQAGRVIGTIELPFLVAMTSISFQNSAGKHQVEDATCLVCGCLCDDIRLQVNGGRIISADRACGLGEKWFLASRPVEEPECTINGQAVSLEAGLAYAAKVLRESKRVLVFGLAGATCEAQRSAIALGDRIGAIVDGSTKSSQALTAAVQSIGMVTASLGEARHRADAVVFWRVDPATTHRRHLERYSVFCMGEFVPNGRADRFVVVVDSQRTATVEEADLFVQLPADGERAAIDALLAHARGEGEIDEAQLTATSSNDSRPWRELFDRMKAARYGVVFFEPNEDTTALLTLVREMNRYTRFVAIPLGGPANSAGGPQVLAWQTGFGTAVNLTEGFPQDSTFASAQDMLCESAVDATLVVACNPLADPLVSLSDAAKNRITKIASVVLRTADWAAPGFEPTVAFTVSTPGIEAGGTVFRSDGVALPLRPAVGAPFLTAEEVLTRLEKCVGSTLSAKPNG
jgi:formylmethanofuran dehydrogenase subunit B